MQEPLLLPSPVTTSRVSSCTLCDEREKLAHEALTKSEASSAAPSPSRAETKLDFDGLSFDNGQILEGHVEDWALGSVLGTGAFSSVRIAKGRKSGRSAAVKTTQFHAFDARTSFFALREALVLSQLPSHPSLPRLLDIIQSANETHVVQSLAEGEELFTYVNNKPEGHLGEDEAARIIAQLLSALSAIHNNGILHRDIKLDNVFVSPSGKVTLIDFGLATFFGSKTVLDEAVGCINYASPSLLRLVNNGTSYGPEMGHSDLWSLGVLAVGMLTGFFPFRSEEPKGLASEIARIPSEGLLGVASGLEGVSEAGKSFLAIVLDPRNEGRISAGLLLKHPWVSRFMSATTPTLSSTSAEKPKIPKIPSPNSVGGVYKARKAVEAHLKSAISKLEEDGRSLLAAQSASRTSLDTVHHLEVARAGSGESLQSEATLTNGHGGETVVATFPRRKKEDKSGGTLKAALAAPGKWFEKMRKR